MESEEFNYKVQPSIRKNLRYYRKKNGFTQEELAKILRVHRGYISALESKDNVKMPSLQLLLKISEVFGVSPGKFLEEIIEEEESGKLQKILGLREGIYCLDTKITENGVQWSNPELNKLEITVVGLPNFKNSIILDESSSSDFLISFADKSVQDLANLGSRYVTAYYRTMILAGICRRRVYGESLKE